MEYSIISTVPNLDLCYENDSDVLMCLAWLAKENSDYFDFYKDAAREKFVILDNGANETSAMTGNELMELALEIGAKEIIAPDVLKDHDATMRETHKFLSLQEQNIYDSSIGIMAVLQGNTVEEIRKCVDFYNKYDNISTIGIGYDAHDLFPLDTVQYNQRNTLSRAFVAHFVSTLTYKPIHLFFDFSTTN